MATYENEQIVHVYVYLPDIVMFEVGRPGNTTIFILPSDTMEGHVSEFDKAEEALYEDYVAFFYLR